jgi:uncharacterized membrane protein
MVSGPRKTLSACFKCLSIREALLSSFVGACLGTSVALMLMTFSSTEKPLVCKSSYYAQEHNR